MKTKISTRAQRALDQTRSRSLCLKALVIFAAQNPGFEWGNYYSGDYKASLAAYRGDSRPVSRQWRKILELLWRTQSVTDDDVREAARHSYSGRLSFAESEKGVEVDYCTGQYWPTEYRQAALAVLTSAVEIADRRWKEQNRVA